MKIIITIISVLFLSLNLSAQRAKENKLLELIDKYYVEKIDTKSLKDATIDEILDKLDPHTVLLPKPENQKQQVSMDDFFAWAGMKCIIYHDTITVINTVKGGSAAISGIKSGDRIIAINCNPTCSKNYKEEDLIKILPNLDFDNLEFHIKRKGLNGITSRLLRNITVSTSCVDASFMLDENTGYIKFNNYGKTGKEDFNKALDELLSNNIKNLVIDLQGNGGGFLGVAKGLVDNFLDADKMIVFTEGRFRGRKEIKSKAGGRFLSGKLAIVVDERTASAAEITSGAIQDHDRGIIVGRRTFGKGLMQFSFALPDGTGIRMTTDRFYSPSGRGLQKDYEKGREIYEKDILKRINTGELYGKYKQELPDSLKYKTLRLNRTVYGGGGILPDVFVPIDVNFNYKVINKLLKAGIIQIVALDYLNTNRDKFDKICDNLNKFSKKYKPGKNIIEDIINEARKQGIECGELNKSITNIIKVHFKAIIAQEYQGYEGYEKILALNDNSVIKAVESFYNNEYEKILNK